MTVKLVGRDDIAATGTQGYGRLFMGKFTAGATGTVSEIKTRVRADEDGDIVLGIYADNAGEPGALFATTASTAVSSGAEREITVSLVANTTVVSGTSYWMATNSTGGNFSAYKEETSVFRYKALAYGALPNPAGSGYTANTIVNCIASGWGTTGWANIAKINGVLSSSIAKVNGIAVASIAKVNGVAV